MIVSFNCLKEDKPGEKWSTLFNKTWPYYKKWFLTEGTTSRKGYLTSVTKLEKYMPEILPIHKQLCELAGGGDLESRFLSMYCPPPYLSGCSQIAWTRDSTALVRNYDYSPKLFEGVMMYTNWIKPVIGVSDCNWGLLDGMNMDGLAVSLTFGGRKNLGTGFGIPVILRYVLETCANVEEAKAVLSKVPVHMSYNVTLLDREKNYTTMYLAPDQPARTIDTAIGTNHQMTIEWADYAKLSGTLERKEFLEECYHDPEETEAGLLRKFLKPPLYNLKFEKSFGTLYTAIYRLENGSAEVRWPSKRLKQSFADYEETKIMINLKDHVHGKLTF